MNLVLTDRAIKDMKTCLIWSGENIGIQATHRHRKLFEVAILDVLADPALPGSKQVKECELSIRIFNIGTSRKSAPLRDLYIKKPRYLFVYRSTDCGCLELLRALDDHMDIEARLGQREIQ